MNHKSPREILGERVNHHGVGGLTVRKWLDANPAGGELVRLWITMRQEGTTDWPGSRLFRYLRSEHGFPFSKNALVGYLSNAQEATSK